jgi:hypothetical protein
MLLSIIHIPLMLTYSSGGEFKQESYASFTIGNLGASSSKCSTIELSAETLNLGCSSGTQIGQITHWGIY